MFELWHFVAIFSGASLVFFTWLHLSTLKEINKQIYSKVRHEKYYGLQGFEWVYFKYHPLDPEHPTKITKEEYEKEVNDERHTKRDATLNMGSHYKIGVSGWVSSTTTAEDLTVMVKMAKKELERGRL